MLLIAEAGVNHNGKIDQAYRLVEAAKNAGADIVKFQFFDSKRLWGDDRIKHLELRFADFDKIEALCRDIGIEFCCTPFGIAELTMLRPLIKRVKVASGMAHRVKFLDAVGETELPVLLSTGMSDQDDIGAALDALRYPSDLTLLQCTSSYPCRMEDVNLQAMVNMQMNFGNVISGIGISDHTTSITVPIAAAALGATVIEKHFTLDRDAEGPDHKASIMPNEFRTMRLAIIEVEAALGDGEKRVLPCEEKLRKAWRT